MLTSACYPCSLPSLPFLPPSLPLCRPPLPIHYRRGTPLFNFNTGDSRFSYQADLRSMAQINLMTGKVSDLR